MPCQSQRRGATWFGGAPPEAMRPLVGGSPRRIRPVSRPQPSGFGIQHGVQPLFYCPTHHLAKMIADPNFHRSGSPNPSAYRHLSVAPSLYEKAVQKVRRILDVVQGSAVGGQIPRRAKAAQRCGLVRLSRRAPFNSEKMLFGLLGDRWISQQSSTRLLPRAIRNTSAQSLAQ
jgi:hypothetical protein